MSDSPPEVRIYADFMKWTGDSDDPKSRWLILTCLGTWRDLRKHNVELSEGLELLFYTDDADDFGNLDELEVRGICHFDALHNYWVAIADWDSIYHVSEKAKRCHAESTSTSSPQNNSPS